VLPGQEVLKKKSVAVGWILLILGLIGLILALIIYPNWQDNMDTLATREHYGVATDDDYAVVAEQTIMVLGGLLVGTPMLLGGAYLVSTRSSYNRKIEGALIQKAMQPSQMYQPAPGSSGLATYGLASSPEHHAHKTPKAPTSMPSGQFEYCPYCGYPLKGAVVCRECGRVP